MAKYSLGLDYGTLSCRALLVNVETGEELASAVFDYPHAVMDEKLPCGVKLGTDWALQDPQDYIDAFSYTITKVISDSGVSADDIIGVGIDFTTCTILPVKADGTPLCFLPQYKERPHAYVKLWKHHAAHKEANKITEIAEARGEKMLARYGGKVSQQWAIPKIWQILNEDPEIYDEMDFFIEAGDWVVWQLTGVQTRNSCMAGYKSFWHKSEGYPSKDFFKSLDPRLENVIEDKFNAPVLPIGSKAGEITPEAASLTGLRVGTSVCVSIADAHVMLPTLKIDAPGKLMMIIGTSNCHFLLEKDERIVPGICGVVEDGACPGFFCYEAGQACCGDHFAWFVKNCMPESYAIAAREAGMGTHEYLTMLADKLSPGESGIIALDWWNGNRSILVDSEVSGLFLGMTLQTKPEELYRALIEATAFGTRAIIENFRQYGIEVNEIYASGGIARKNKMMMQIYSDVVNMPIRIGGSSQGGALGSAVFGAVAAGGANGGYDDYYDASRAMGNLSDDVYTPNADNVEPYDRLYKEYMVLHDYFGRGMNDVMKRLRK